MTKQQGPRPSLHIYYPILGLLVLSAPAVSAVTADAAEPASIWNILIALIVLAATAGSAALNIAAIRNWDRNWGLVSGLPLAGLLLWCLLIVVGISMDAGAHGLWPLEIFAWAMINMIYMVTAMTAKRMFAKRDGEEAASS